MRSWWDFDEGESAFLGQGACHDLRERQNDEPKLWQCKSVSRAAAIALDKGPKPTRQRRIGFVTGPRR